MNRLVPLIHYTNRYGSHRLLQQHINKRNITRTILYHQTTIFQQQQQRSITTTHKHTHQTTLNNIHPQHLYQIINNVDEYYSFLPYCNESKILQTSNCGTMYDAVLKVGLPSSSSLLPGSSSSLLEERYVSRVKMIPPSTKDSNTKQPIWVVEAKSIQSQLFDSLKSRWELSIADDTNQSSSIDQQQQYINNNDSRVDTNNVQSTATSCNVNFEVEIQVSNPLISFTLNQVLKDVAKKQVDAFEKRCIDIVPMKI